MFKSLSILFFVSLLSTVTASSGPEDFDQSGRHHSLTFLLVDDQPMFFAIEKGSVEKVCRKLGITDYSIKTAGNGQQGLSMFNNFKPQIVITDLNMPGEFNGDELGRRIRETNWGGGNTVKLILATSKYSTLSREFRDRNLKGQAFKMMKKEEPEEANLKKDNTSWVSEVGGFFFPLFYTPFGTRSAQESEVVEEDEIGEPPFDAICDKGNMANLEVTLEAYIKALIN